MYELIELDSFAKAFTKRLKLGRRNEEKVRQGIVDELGENPYNGTPMKGVQTVSGRKIHGLRHEKLGVANYRGGLVVLYRICEECIRYGYHAKGGPKCQFCNPEITKRVVLFDIHPRGKDYG